MHYYTYEMAHSVLAPLRWGAQGVKSQLTSPLNPFRQMLGARMMAAGIEVFESITRRYGKPEFGITETRVVGMPVPVSAEVVLKKPFCHLVHFARDEAVLGKRHDPKVAPMSGHYATLLRGTVEAMIPEHDVYITDWIDARNVPVTEGAFDLDDYIDYIIAFIRFLGPNTHVIAVCQPSVPALAAAAVMGARNDPLAPASMTLMGGPIDTRRNPTVVNNLAAERPIEWFRKNVIASVPFPNPGFMRRVYPGFIQLSGFMQMNLDRHMTAHNKLFDNLVKGDCDSVQNHRDFYEEYLAVMDLPAEFYLQTVQQVFQEHTLPDRKMLHRGELVDCRAITKTALMTVEGERDDICGLGQTEAAHDLCASLPMDEKYHYVQQGVGHYGVFNGTRWRTEIQPRIREFIRTIQFKRMVGTQSRMSLPYRGLKQDREAIVEYKVSAPQVGSVAPH
jgi:poly(3-hydroxybutyrate) depolymerase